MQAQNVGVGTTTPQSRLHIVAPSGYSFPLLQVEMDGSAGPYLIVQPDGKVGIGVANPAEVLDISGNVQFSGALMPSGDAGTAGFVLMSQGTGNPPVWVDTALLKDNWGSQVAVTQSPIVGDGTSANPIGLQGGTNTGDILIWDGTQWVIKSSPFDSVCGTAMANYVMKWTGSELCNSIIYDDGARVGIGTTSPTHTLHIAGSVYVQDSLRVDGDFRPGGNPGTAGQVLISQGVGVAPQWQMPPQFQGWYLWHVDYWGAGPTDPGPQGWTGATTTNCGGQWLLGGYNQCGQGCVLSKTFSGLPPHSQVMVEVFWWSIDSWDQHSVAGTDSITLYLDNQKASIAIPYVPYGWVSASSSSNNNRASDRTICGNNAIDIGPQVMVGHKLHSQTTLTVDIRNGVNQSSTDESLGIQMVRIWLKP